ncbi:Uncharacterised protein [Vibrio cholerae]|nr:Uncharacterised protein [Vibrio cholerae]
MNFGFNPVHRKRHQSYPHLRVKAFNRFHQTDIALLH